MPCAGTFLLQPRLAAESFLREWWDFDLPSKNFKHFHEQDALWHMLENPECGFKLNFNSTVSILTQWQFPSEWDRFETLWLCHISSYNFALRRPILSTMLHYLNLKSSSAYQKTIAHIQLYRVDMLQASEDMEKLSQTELTASNRITKFPKHDEMN